MSKVITTNKLKGNPWNSSDSNKDRRLNNTGLPKGRNSAKRNNKRK
jgi:hypothetical protein